MDYLTGPYIAKPCLRRSMGGLPIAMGTVPDKPFPGR